MRKTGLQYQVMYEMDFTNYIDQFRCGLGLCSIVLVCILNHIRPGKYANAWAGGAGGGTGGMGG